MGGNSSQGCVACCVCPAGRCAIATGGLKEGLLHSCLSIPHTLITPRSSVRAVCSLQYDEENGSDITLRRSVKYRLNLCPCVFGRVKGVLRSRVRIRVNAIFWLISCE